MFKLNIEHVENIKNYNALLRYSFLHFIRLCPAKTKWGAVVALKEVLILRLLLAI